MLCSLSITGQSFSLWRGARVWIAWRNYQFASHSWDGKGGKYLLVPPGYKGELPTEGYFIVPFKTMNSDYFIRGIVVKGDVAGAADMLAKSRVYPYSGRANPKPNRVLRVSGKYANTIPPDGLAYWKLFDWRAFPQSSDPFLSGPLRRVQIRSKLDYKARFSPSTL